MLGLPYVGMGDGSPLPELNTNVLRRYLVGVLAILSASSTGDPAGTNVPLEVLSLSILSQEISS